MYHTGSAAAADDLITSSSTTAQVTQVALHQHSSTDHPREQTHHREWWMWAMISTDGVGPSRMVGVSASVSLPLHHKVQKFSSGTGSPGWSRKRAVKRLWWLCSTVFTHYSLLVQVQHKNSIIHCKPVSVLTMLAGQQEWHPVYKKLVPQSPKACFWVEPHSSSSCSNITVNNNFLF